MFISICDEYYSRDKLLMLHCVLTPSEVIFKHYTALGLIDVK